MSNSDSEQQKEQSRERRSRQRASLMIAQDHPQPVVKKRDDEQPKKKKGGGLGVFFKMNTPADNGGAGKDWDDTSRGGYSTVSKMFRAKSRKTKQPAASSHIIDNPNHQQEKAEDSYMNKLDGFLTRQQERTARREVLDSDEQSRGAYSTVGRLQHTTTPANHRSPRKPSSRNVTTSSSACVRPIKSSSSRNISNSHKSSRHLSTAAAAAPSDTMDRKVQQLERQPVTRSKAQHSSISSSSTTKERSKNRTRSKRSDSCDDGDGDHHRSMRSSKSTSSFSSSPRKQLSSGHSTSRRHRSGNTDASETIKMHSSRSSLSPVKENTKSSSRSSRSKHYHSNSNSQSSEAALFKTHEPLQFDTGASPTHLTFSPVQVSPGKSDAGRAIQLLQSNNSKPSFVVAPPKKEDDDDNGGADRDLPSSASQNQHTNGSSKPSFSKQESSSSRNKQTHATKGPPTQSLSRTSTSTSRSREMEGDLSSRTHRKGSSRNSSKSAARGEHNHHPHGELLLSRSSSRRSSKTKESFLTGEQQQSKIKKDSSDDDQDLKLFNGSAMKLDGGGGGDYCSDSDDDEDEEAKKLDHDGSGKKPRAARRSRRSSGGNKSKSDPRHSGGQSSSSSSSLHADGKIDCHDKNKNNSTSTQEGGRHGSNRERSGSSFQNNTSSRNRQSSQREKHSSQQDLKRENTNDDVAVTSTSSDADEKEEIGQEEEGDHEDDGDVDDDDEATFAEASEVIDRLKTSHLRRLVEPPRRVARKASQSSAYSSTIGSVSSRCDDSAVISRSLRKPVRKESEHSVSSWRPPHSRRSVDDGKDNDVEKDSFEIDMNHQRRKSDCAPVTPRRRSSGGSKNSFSVKTCIEEEGEESSSSPNDFVEFNRIEEDIFSSFTWSKAKQDPVAIERERTRMRDAIRDTPFYQAYESTGIPDKVAR